MPSLTVSRTRTVSPREGVEVITDDNGEILVRSPGLLREYYKPEATAEAKDADGCNTGDAGYFGDDGHLRIIDWSKDVGNGWR